MTPPESTPEPKFNLGDLVEVDLEIFRAPESGIEVNLTGRCRLYVVGRSLMAGENWWYAISDIPVQFVYTWSPLDPEKLMFRYIATIVEHLPEGSLRPVEHPPRELYPTVDHWLRSKS